MVNPMRADPVEKNVMSLDVPVAITSLQRKFSLSPTQLASTLGVSLVAIDRWMRGVGQPSSQQMRLLQTLMESSDPRAASVLRSPFPSKGATRRALTSPGPDLFSSRSVVGYDTAPGAPVLTRIAQGHLFGQPTSVSEILSSNDKPARTPVEPVDTSPSAGKNTYTYDAHTYHTKVPPQGIFEFLNHYLPDGGLVLDPFAGSGMTGVAALVAGNDVILSDLSPAACFIAHNFTESIAPDAFVEALDRVLAPLAALREQLYTTTCRECASPVEASYYVWSYRVSCYHCESEFCLWNHSRKYGRTVREHKILSTFPCPHCKETLTKRKLTRSIVEPVAVAYKCCARGVIRHPPDPSDLDRISAIDKDPPIASAFVPDTELPDGVNLNQPKRHGLTTVASFYTSRNLSALSQIWRSIHCLSDPILASGMGFVFTSLYQRVTRLAEFRFWGGSGNTARFNVPFVFKEMNVFAAFHRKAVTILDHLETTASQYRARKAVICGSATELTFLPSESVDLVFTDPPFGANINYSELNILWESWLGQHTDSSTEVIINRFQGKDLPEYGHLMEMSLRECHRVLRTGHWLLLAFMNSSAKVWEELRTGLSNAGFSIARVDVFDKQHGTFKQFVSANTPGGCDLVIHCRKTRTPTETAVAMGNAEQSIVEFVEKHRDVAPTTVFLHVSRAAEIDYRRLYSDWIGYALTENAKVVGFEAFRELAKPILEGAG